MQKRSFCLLVLAACSGGPADNHQPIVETEKSDTVVEQSAGEPSVYPEISPDPAVYDDLQKKVTELALPAKVETPHEPDSSWPELSATEIGMFVPSYQLEGKAARVYAMHRIPVEGGSGMLYYIGLPITDPEDVDETTGKVVLVLYDDSLHSAADLELSVREYSWSWSILSGDQIIYTEESEMEFIHITQTTYRIDGLEFEEIKSEDFEFNGDQKGSDESSEFLSQFEAEWLGTRTN